MEPWDVHDVLMRVHRELVQHDASASHRTAIRTYAAIDRLCRWIEDHCGPMPSAYTPARVPDTGANL